MPIMGAHARSDARGNAQLLASVALESMADPSVAKEQEVALSNVHRLIESFRTDPSFGVEVPSRQPDQNATARLALRRPLERHVGEVRSALAGALETAFVERPNKDAAQIVANVLRFVAYPEVDQPEPTPIDRDRTVTFLQEFARRLDND